MPLYQAKPYYVEAQRFAGTTLEWPEEFRRAVTRYLNDGTIQIQTIDGPRACRCGDWVINGPGGFEIVHHAPFEAMFDIPAPIADQKRPAARKVSA